MGLESESVMVKSAVQSPRPASTEGTAWGSGAWAKAGCTESRTARRVIIARHYKTWIRGRLNGANPAHPANGANDGAAGVLRAPAAPDSATRVRALALR